MAEDTDLPAPGVGGGLEVGGTLTPGGLTVPLPFVVTPPFPPVTPPVTEPGTGDEPGTDDEPGVTVPTGPITPPIEVPVPEPDDEQPAGGTTTPHPGIPEALPDLSKLAGLIIVLGLIAALSALTEFFNRMFSLFLSPFTGGRKVQPLTTQGFGQTLSSTLAGYVQGIDTDIGLSFTKLGEMTSRVGLALEAGAAATYQVAAKVAGLDGDAAGNRARAAVAKQRADAATATAATALKGAQVETQRALAAEKALREQLKGVTYHVTNVIEPELEALRKRIPELERGATTTWDEVKKHEELFGLAAVTAAVAAGLGKLGGSWIRCENNQKIGQQLCGPTGNALSRLLRGALPLLAFADVCGALKLASALLNTGAVQDSISLGADGVAGLMHCAGSEGADVLNTAYYSPGPLTAWAAPGTVASQV